jgi:hypothetical protein
MSPGSRTQVKTKSPTLKSMTKPCVSLSHAMPWDAGVHAAVGHRRSSSREISSTFSELYDELTQRSGLCEER